MCGAFVTHPRLCPRAELHTNVCQGTGCGHDARLVWTSDEAMPPSPPPPPPPQLYHYSEDADFVCEDAGKHERASAVCVAKGRRLCRWDEVCPGGSTPGQQYATSQASDVLADWIGGAKTTDEWMAIEPVMINSMNTEWIQIGARSSGTDLCEVISQFGYPNFNSFGCQTYTGYIACCGAPPVVDQDCVLGQWYDMLPAGWSDLCSQPCGGGVKHQQRDILVSSVGNGSCGTQHRTVACNTQACRSCTTTPSKYCGNYANARVTISTEGACRADCQNTTECTGGYYDYEEGRCYLFGVSGSSNSNCNFDTYRSTANTIRYACS